MSDTNHDKVFLYTFMSVLAVLVGITVTIYVVAAMLSAPGDELDPVVREQIEKRIAPVGTAYTDASAIPKPVVTAPAEPRSAKAIVEGTCAGCHGTGVLGAPKLDDSATWKAEVKTEGVDYLVKAAIEGEGAMPPRGGDASLSDDEVEAAVKYILKNAGAI